MIKLKNIRKKLSDFTINNINLDVKKGEYLVILGPTGTGKTILLELIAGLIKADQGQIFFDDKNVSGYPPEDRKVGMVYQDYMLFPHLNVKDNIAFGLNIKGVKENKIKSEVKEIVELFSIDNLLNRNVKTLSGGEQQRVALARALITSPQVLLLDEPLSALDPSTKESFQTELKKIHNKLKTTTLHVTHDFKEALALADRIAIMNEGNIIQIGNSDEIFKRPANNFVANFIDSKNIFSVKKIKNNVVQIEGQDSLINISVIGSCKNKSNIVIRPENIIISNEKFKSTALNCFKGEIIHIVDKIVYLEVMIDIGVEIFACITKQSSKNIDIFKGKEVYITFKASSVHIF
ncbi:MAG: ABC transporter ATP-binding protein [Bacillota bacterium]